VSRVNALSALLIRSPLLWGGAVAFFFFALIHGGLIRDANVVRYLAGHWVEYVEVVLFCVGLAALAIKACDIAAQRRTLDEEILPAIPAGGQNPMEAVEMRDSLPAAEPAAQHVLVRRMRDALDLVVRTGTADGLEDHLKYLADLDAARAASSYGLVRFVVWAIPIMGFLGTVIGITVAIASLSPTQLENISGVVAGLGTAFDTTATALALSMVLMFVQFLIDRSEQKLLGRVDAAAWESLAGRFQSLATGDGTAQAVARLGEAVGRSSERLISAQEDSWRSLERAASGVIGEAMGAAGDQLRQSLEASIDSALGRWAESLAAAQASLTSQREDRWALASESMAAAMRSFEQHQKTLAGQTELLEKVVEATRDVASLERVLDANLTTLRATGRFEELVATLAASVQLLAARAGDAAADVRHVDLQSARRSGKAA
jgi:biopolymer transport protein ExbB/TolQ